MLRDSATCYRLGAQAHVAIRIQPNKVTLLSKCAEGEYPQLIHFQLGLPPTTVGTAFITATVVA